MSRFRVGIDIGGTFTDIVFLNSEGRLFTKKVPSSVDNYARAIVEGMAEVFDEASITPKDIRELRHGTTVASNAILELKGARVGLITSAGFRDVLEIRTLRMPRLYDLAWEKPPSLVERYLRQVVDERINANGVIERRPQRSEVEQVVRRLLDEKVEAIAICLINGYENPDNVSFVEDIVREMAPDIPLCISADVLPEMKEYERTSTTVINAYVLPVVGTYLTALRKGLDGDGISAPIYLMQSNGGLTTSETASKLPMHIIESGPAGGVIGSQAWAAQPSAGDDQFDAVYVPVTAVHTLLNLSKLNTITASARSSGETSRLAQEITTLLRQRHGITEQLPDDFTVRTQAEQVLGQGLPPQVARVVAGNMNSVDSITMEQLSGSLERANTTMMLLLVGVAGISLLVGGIGVVNLLLLSVTQRTNEVGPVSYTHLTLPTKA